MKGILFRPEVWQAKLRVLEQYGEAQTRRVIKPQPTKPVGTAHDWEWKPAGMLCYDDYFREHAPNYARYHIGETVYIKEAWSDIYCWGRDQVHVLYALDYPPAPKGFKWRSPMFMPAWAARYFIVIEQVRAERVQVITIADSVAEGVPCQELGIKDDELCRGQFADLWDSINPKYPWESNPWVFPYTFRLKEVK